MWVKLPKALALNPCPWDPSAPHVTYYPLCFTNCTHTYNFEGGQQNAYQAYIIRLNKKTDVSL